jgi:alpha,alpha-trehalase
MFALRHLSPAWRGDVVFAPETLQQYALLADGERGALIGPRGDIAFLCAPRWHDDVVLSGLLGGQSAYAVTPHDPRFTWGGHYEQGSLVWRSRWVTTESVIECREALAHPGDRDRVVLLRRVEPLLGAAHVDVALHLRAGFDAHPMSVHRTDDTTWEGRSGDIVFRWTGVPETARVVDGAVCAQLAVPANQRHDLVLEVARGTLPRRPPDAERCWRTTEDAWAEGQPDLSASVAPRESQHSYVVLRGLTSRDGGMVAAATTSMPERANRGRNYDYRYAWIRDQAYAGQAAAAVGADDLLGSAVRFVSQRVLEDGDRLAPAYTVSGDPVCSERAVELPGYPGAPVRIGNHVNDQFQLDNLGEGLLLLSAADARHGLDGDGTRAVESLVGTVRRRWREPDAGIWELQDRRWAHSRLMCVAGLRAAAARRGGDTAREWEQLAETVLRSVDEDCGHTDGRWQRAPDDQRVDAALVLAGVRGAVAGDDPRQRRTVEAVLDDLADDGFVYRFRQDAHESLHSEEGAFLLCGFQLSLALLAQGEAGKALRWYERNRSALGPPGLFAEEFDVVERQLRGNLPQAFVHALVLETGHRLAAAGLTDRGFIEEDI